MIKKISRNILRERRQKRVRAVVKGTASKPRLCVFKSLTNLYVQAIDDENKSTLASTSTLSLKLKGANIENAKKVGQDIAKKLLDKKIDTVVFDRNGYLYHGKVKEIAESARSAGLKF